MGTISFKIYPDLKLAHFQGFGDVSHDMLIKEIRQLHSHPEWSFSFNTFIDLEKAVINYEADSISKYQNYFGNLQEIVPVRKWAIYTCQDSPHQAFDMNRLPNLRNIIFDVFPSREDALKFLNILPHQLEAPASE